MKKPVIVFTIADEKNLPLARQLEKSFKKFHPDVPFEIYSGDELKANLQYDQHFFYRATPILAEKYIKDYELVVKIDADSIITGPLDYVFTTKDYDIGTVLNWNRVDPQNYGIVQGWGIDPVEYFNCGFVAMRSEKFIHHWNVVCFSPQFERLQYREQDLLNILCYYGNYNVRCFDHGDGPANMHAWWGLIAKGEWLRATVKNGKIVIPQGKDNFPKRDLELKVIHLAGGHHKPSYKTLFQEDVIKKIDELVS